MPLKKDMLDNYFARGASSGLSNKKKLKVFDLPDFSEPETASDNYTVDNGQQTVNSNASASLVKPQQIAKKRSTNGQQTVNDKFENTLLDNNAALNRLNLVGLEKKIVDMIYANCVSNQDRITRQLKTSDISNLVQSSQKSVKTTIYRLKKKGIVILAEYKDGRGGWSKYTLSSSAFNLIKATIE